MKLGDILEVEIGGSVIGDAIVSEITDDYVEVVYQGSAHKLSPWVAEYFETRRDLSGL